MKLRDICEFFLRKNDKSFVRNCIYEKLLDYERKNPLQCMNIIQNIDYLCANLQMEYELVSIFEKICDKNLYSEYMCMESKVENATLIFFMAHQIDKIGISKLTEDSYNWFKKQLLESMFKILKSMTLFNEVEWEEYLMSEHDENKNVKYVELLAYSLLTLWTVKIAKKLITEILN